MAKAANPIEGTWGIDVRKFLLSQKPRWIELSNGRYKCLDCGGPQIDVKSDGTDQKVSGYPAFETMNVKAADGRTVEISYKTGGKLTEVQKLMVSADGNQLTTVDNSPFPAGNPKPYGYTIVDFRAGRQPAGSHAISGEWKRTSVINISGNPSTFIFRNTSDGMTFSQPGAGISSARIDGKDYPIEGNPGIDSV
jgi:hypothetical protein